MSLTTEGPCWVRRDKDGAEPEDEWGGLDRHFATAEEAAKDITELSAEAAGEGEGAQAGETFAARGWHPVHLDVPCVLVTCDECGYRDDEEDEGIVHYTSEAEAERRLLGDGDWLRHGDGRWFCWGDDCRDAAVAAGVVVPPRVLPGQVGLDFGQGPIPRETS